MKTMNNVGRPPKCFACGKVIDMSMSTDGEWGWKVRDSVGKMRYMCTYTCMRNSEKVIAEQKAHRKDQKIARLKAAYAAKVADQSAAAPQTTAQEEPAAPVIQKRKELNKEELYMGGNISRDEIISRLVDMSFRQTGDAKETLKYQQGIEDALQMARELPNADEPAPHDAAMTLLFDYDGSEFGYRFCSSCKTIIGYKDFRYCPGCGARFV